MVMSSLNKRSRCVLGNRIALCLFVTLLATPKAWAAGRASKERTARKACLSGNADKGVGILSDLYLDSMDTTYIYNQGRCYEQNHRWEDALARFLEYLRKTPDLEESKKTETEKHIADCQAFLGKNEPPRAPSAEVEKVTPHPSVTQNPPPSVYAPPTPVTVEQTPAQPTPPARSGLRTAGVITAGLGGAALITAVILNVKVNSMSSSLEQKWAQDTDSSRRTYKTVGWVAYGAGGACLAAGAVLYFLGLQNSSSQSVTIAPSVASGQIGALLGGSF
jgi:hypothetical protein